MILSRDQILEGIEKGNITITPFDLSRLNPNSYNLRLDNELLVYDNDILDMKKNDPYTKIKIPKSGLILQPNKLYLGKTVEYTKTNKYVPMLEGRSSIGRKGMSIHITAGFGDIGFKGYWTLEIAAVQPLKIYPFMEVCQIYYCETGHIHLDYYYHGKYDNNNGIQPSMMYEEFE